MLIEFFVFPTEHKKLSLATLEDIIEQAKSDGYSDRHEADEDGKFADDAPAWSRQNSGIEVSKVLVANFRFVCVTNSPANKRATCARLGTQ